MDKAQKAGSFFRESKKKQSQKPPFKILKEVYSPRLEEVDGQGPVLKKVKDKL